MTNMTLVQKSETLAIEMWMKEQNRDSIVGWGDVPETYEYRARAKEILMENQSEGKYDTD